MSKEYLKILCPLNLVNIEVREELIMRRFVGTLLRRYNGFMTEHYEISDGKDLYQAYAIYKFPDNFSLRWEQDFIPASNCYLIRYRILEEPPNSEVARKFHRVKDAILKDGLEKLLGIE